MVHLQAVVWLCFLILISPMALGSSHPEHFSIEMSPAMPHYDVGRKLSYLEDPHKLLSIDDFLTDTQQILKWQISEEAVPNFGYTRSAYWFHFHIAELHRGEQQWLVEIDYSLLDDVEVFFVQDDSVVRSYRTGDLNRFSQRPIQHRNFVFPVPEVADNYHVYIRVVTAGTLELPLRLWQSDAFWGAQQPILMVKGIYYGTIFIMILYNLFIYFSVRESSYFYYVCYAAFLVMFQSGIDGFAFQFIWPEEPGWHSVSFVVFSAFTLSFLCLFSNSFLKLEQRHPNLSKMLLAGSVLTILVAVAALFVPYALAIRLVVALSIPVSFACFGVGLYLWFEGVKTARYFIIAWTAFLGGVTLIALSKLGLIPVNFITTNSIQMGSALEVVLFSLALADRINTDKRERLQAKEEAINNLEMFKSLYDNAIEGIFQCTLDGRFISANQSMVRFMGYNSSTSFLQNITDTGPQIFLDLTQYHEFRKAVLDRGQVLNYEAQGVRKDGSPFWCSLSAKLVNSRRRNEPIIEGFVVDVTARKKSEEQLNFLAHHDPLTGLVNRREFEFRLERALVQAKQTESIHSILYMDLDQFKLVNDTSGHIAGDELLRQITHQLQTHMRGCDTLARLGGDEFGVLLERCSGEDAVNVAHKLRQLIQDFRFSWDSKIFTLGVSIGLVPISSETESVKTLLSLADSACYAAKEAGRNRVHEYTPGDAELANQQSEMQWASRIAKALEENRLVLYRQSICPIDRSLKEGAHYEMLVRLDEDGSEIFPGAFMPAAERYNLMPAIDRWVVSNVFLWLHQNPEILESLALCSINLSGLTLGDEQFTEFLKVQFESYKIEPSKICFEITETVAVTNLTKTIIFINQFKALGCKFSLDDFGSGFSSYGYLKNLPVDYLKIDGSFVIDIVHDKIDFAMVESINRIGHVMGKKTIAEFVENEAILAKLADLKVDYAQGYAIDKPQRITSK